MKAIPTALLDLGFAMGRIEEGSDGEPCLTIMTPACDTEHAASIVVSGWDTLEALGITLAEYCRVHRQDCDSDMTPGVDIVDGLV